MYGWPRPERRPGGSDFQRRIANARSSYATIEVQNTPQGDRRVGAVCGGRACFGRGRSGHASRRGVLLRLRGGRIGRSGRSYPVRRYRCVAGGFRLRRTVPDGDRRTARSRGRPRRRALVRDARARQSLRRGRRLLHGHEPPFGQRRAGLLSGHHAGDPGGPALRGELQPARRARAEFGIGRRRGVDDRGRPDPDLHDAARIPAHVRRIASLFGVYDG